MTLVDINTSPRELDGNLDATLYCDGYQTKRAKSP